MQLSYRGVRYTQESTSMDMVESGMVGTYRGQAFPFKYPRHVPVSQPVQDLVYRGAAYRTTASGGTVSVKSSESSRPVAASAKSETAPSCLLEQARRIPSTAYERTHRSNIQRRLQQRIEAAKARGDQKLLNLLEREMRQAG